MGSSLPCPTLKCTTYFSSADTDAKFGSIDLEENVQGGKWKCPCYRIVYVIFVDFIIHILLHEHRWCTRNFQDGVRSEVPLKST